MIRVICFFLAIPFAWFSITITMHNYPKYLAGDVTFSMVVFNVAMLSIPCSLLYSAFAKNKPVRF